MIGYLGAGAAGTAADDPGLLDRRRVRRCRHLHGRVRAEPQARFFGSFLEFGTLAGFSGGALLMLGFSLVLSDDADERLGLAAALPRCRAARPDRDLPAVPDGGHPGLPRAGGERGQGGADLHQFKDLVGRLLARSCGSAAWSIALNVVNYTLLTYMPTYLEKSIGLTLDQSLIVPIIGMLVMMVFAALRRPHVRPGRAQTAVVVRRWSACSCSACRCSC